MRVFVRGIDSEVSSWSFDGGDRRVVVGAHPSCDWRVSGPGIGLHHVELAWFEGYLWVRALAHASGRELAAPGQWQPLEDGATFELGAARVSAVAGAVEAAPAAWDAGDRSEPTVVAARAELDTVITSCPDAGRGASLRDLPAVAEQPGGRPDPHTAIIHPGQLRQWAAEAEGSAPRAAAAAPAPVGVAQRLRASAPQRAAAGFADTVDDTRESDTAADESGAAVFAMPPPVESAAPPVARPPLWRTLWWAIPGRAALVASALAAMVCFVWFPRLLSAEGGEDGVRARTRPVPTLSARAARSRVAFTGAPHVATPELAEQESAAAAQLAAGRYREALAAYERLAEQAPDVPAYAEAARLLRREVAGGRCAAGEGRCAAP